MDKFYILFFDHLGNFQWSSVAASVSFLVLLAQVAQFIYQQDRLKKNKKLDIWIELRAASLKEVKECIKILLEHTTVPLSNENLIIFRQSQNGLLVNLNRSNDVYNQFIETLNEYIVEYNSYMSGETEVFDSKIIIDLATLYDSYENKEIDTITNYKIKN